MQNGVILLILLGLVQMGFVGATALLYSRMRSKADAEKASMTPWGIRVEAALGTAESAKAMVDKLEVEHFKNLRSMFETQVMQIAQLKGELLEANKRIDSLEVKVQTLQRMDRHERKKEAAELLPHAPAAHPDDGLMRAIQEGQAIPLAPYAGAPQNGAAPRSTFGQKAK